VTRAHLIADVGRVAVMTPEESERSVEAILDAIVRALRSGDDVEIRGFGSFRIRNRKARVGRNPKTGALVDVPAKRVAHFKAGKELKVLLQNAQSTPEAQGD
jgi:integration host factor subunit beta